jgi:meiotically up-regulated gene 157 (Mug157) protein
MAVLQRTANRFNTDNRISVYPFSQFENKLFSLIKLKKGDFYFIDHADFSFSDTSCYYKYMPQSWKYAVIIHESLNIIEQNIISDEQIIYRAFIKLYN